MTSAILIGLAAAIVLIALASLFRRRDYVDLNDHPPDSSPGLHLSSGPRRTTQEERDAADAQFREAFLGDLWRYVDRYFHTKIVGVSRRNSDGTSRLLVIESCSPSEELVIVWEKGNRYDQYAKAVKRKNGHQLGYIPHDIAADIHEDFFTFGLTWVAVFKSANRHPETGHVVGANILLARKSAEKMAKVEAATAEALRRERQDLEAVGKIRDAVERRLLPETFSPADVNKAIGGIVEDGFLFKHREGNPSGDAEFFVRVSRGLYRLK